MANPTLPTLLTRIQSRGSGRRFRLLPRTDGIGFEFGQEN